MTDQTKPIGDVSEDPPEPEQHTQVIPEDSDQVAVYPDQTPETLDEDEGEDS